MRNIIVAVCLLSSTAASAHDYRRRVPTPQPRPYYHNDRSIMPWVAGGLLLGAMGGMYMYNQRRCYDELVGYDRRGREIWERYCD